MKRKQLTQPQAWRKIGNDILNGGEMRHGLCHNIGLLFLHGELPYETVVKMEARVDWHVSAATQFKRPYPYIAPQGKAREARAMLCYLLALEAEEDEEDHRLHRVPLRIEVEL